jgi:hypothetical protein
MEPQATSLRRRWLYAGLQAEVPIRLIQQEKENGRIKRLAEGYF